MATSDERLKINLELPVGEDALMGMATQLAGQATLTAWHMGREVGLTPRDALALASYMVLRGQYGRPWVKAHLGLSERSERRWAALARQAAEHMPEDPDEGTLRLVVSATEARGKRSGR